MEQRKFLILLGMLFVSLIDVGCFRMRGPNGGGQIDAIPPRSINANDIGLQPGYKIEPVISGLNFPSAVAFDDSNHLYVIEAGYSYGEVWENPKLLKVEPQ